MCDEAQMYHLNNKITAIIQVTFLAYNGNSG
jgi:hypothetical protein